jgi:cytoskeleton-associated protein 5
MGTLMKILGERQMNPYMEGLDEIRKVKIKEYFESAQVKAKEKPKPVAPPPAPAAAKGPAKKRLLGGKPGLKAPAKAAPPVAEELPPQAAPTKPAGRGVPSKLGVPKAGASGLKLQKKVLGPAGGNAGPLASPKRALPKAASPPLDDEPSPPPAPKLGLGRGLAGRALQKEVPAPVVQPRVDPGISAAEKAELEELRAEKEHWMKQQHDDKVERAKLNQEINDLQLQVRGDSIPASGHY